MKKHPNHKAKRNMPQSLKLTFEIPDLKTAMSS